MNRVRTILSAMGLFVCLMSLAFPVVAGDTLDEIYALADRKDFDTALKKLNSFLAAHPQDAQGRFLKGLIFTETKQFDQAINVFMQLSKDFPELPEPYNNLAVLYAERGQFDKAQEALLQAVKTHPNYSTAHENLGDIYAKMASQSYSRALKLNPGNTVLTGKLNKVKTLFTDRNAGSEPKSAAAPPPPPPPRAASVPPPPAKEVAAAAAAVAPLPKETAPPPQQAATAPKAIALPPPPSAESAPEPPAPTLVAKAPQQQQGEGEKAKGQQQAVQEVQQAVHAWAAAWSAKNVNQYLGAYSAKFQPISKTFKTRAEWEKNRRDTIGKAGEIFVSVTDLQVNMLNENRAQTTFRQHYTAKNYRDQVKKALSLERENHEWKIVREYAAE